ncbi:MAG: coniferyl aldehyde dehydrogenase [Azonexus sp.]|nr:coniferyl aldehyde dehydrogenase [Azonexus sp.]
MSASIPLVNDVATLDAAFARIRQASRADLPVPVAERRRRLDALEALLHDNIDALCNAVSADFGQRSQHETRLLEIFPSVEGIRHTRRHLARWSKPQRRPVSLWFQPGRAEVRPQPLGCVGIVTPWNYPIYLAIGPLTAAFAAGNRALVKMSEFTPSTATVLAELARRYFTADELAIVEGDMAVAEAFSRLPFDHLLFTGSTAVGRHVMRAAAEHLTPVTLELGGKSPAIVAPDYPLEKAAARILSGKCLNAGQTCIAPDYLFVPAGQEQAFAEAARRVVAKNYPDIARNPDYTAIVNERHYQRLNAYLDDARARGATLLPLAACPPEAAARRCLPPTLIFGANDEMRVMQDEIFGPLLPVFTYDRLDDALAFVNSRDRPLALYLFDNDRRRIRHVLDHTIAGGVTINDTILHIAQENLPFGGVGPSGMGHYHGHEGFLTFSKLKPVFYQARINGIGLFNPPYGKLFERLLKVLLR